MFSLSLNANLADPRGRAHQPPFPLDPLPLPGNVKRYRIDPSAPARLSPRRKTCTLSPTRSTEQAGSIYLQLNHVEGRAEKGKGQGSALLTGHPLGEEEEEKRRKLTGNGNGIGELGMGSVSWE